MPLILIVVLAVSTLPPNPSLFLTVAVIIRYHTFDFDLIKITNDKFTGAALGMCWGQARDKTQI